MNYMPTPLPSGLRGRTHECGLCEAEGGTCFPAQASWSSPGLLAPPAPHPSPGTRGPGSSGAPVRRAFSGQRPGTWVTRAPVSTACRASCPHAGRGGQAPCGRLWVGLSNWPGLGLLPKGFPGGATIKEPAGQCGKYRRPRFDAWVGKIPWRRV